MLRHSLILTLSNLKCGFGGIGEFTQTQGNSDGFVTRFFIPHTHRTPATLNLSPDHCNLLFIYYESAGTLRASPAFVERGSHDCWGNGQNNVWLPPLVLWLSWHCDPSSLSTCTHGDWDHCCDPVLFDKGKTFVRHAAFFSVWLRNYTKSWQLLCNRLH